MTLSAPAADQLFEARVALSNRRAPLGPYRVPIVTPTLWQHRPNFTRISHGFGVANDLERV